jgi:DNA-binding transcriptional LysR family regulator
MKMTDFRLTSLLEVVRSGGFSSAAENLHLTQPAVSQHIASLEERYGVALVTRSGRKTIPTSAGRLLYRYAEKVEALYRSIERDMTNLHLVERTYEVGATLTVAEYLLPNLVGAYRRAHPHIKIRLSVQNTKATAEMLRRNRLVLGLVEGPLGEDGLFFKTLQTDELIAVCSPSHSLSGRSAGRRVTLDAFLSSDIILREPGSGTREVFERYLASQGYDPKALRPLMEIGSNNAIKLLIESDLGVSVLSRLAVENELRRGDLVAIHLAGPGITRELRFAWTEYSDAEFVHDFLTFCERRADTPML